MFPDHLVDVYIFESCSDHNDWYIPHIDNKLRIVSTKVANSALVYHSCVKKGPQEYVPLISMQAEGSNADFEVAVRDTQEDPVGSEHASVNETIAHHGKGYLKTIKLNLQADIQQLWGDLLSQKLSPRELKRISCIVTLKVSFRYLTHCSITKY